MKKWKVFSTGWRRCFRCRKSKKGINNK